ncbi:MAG: OmpA family protein [Oleiphilaceae bacterium]|nr:OmpA family protein [Oleiphilaceae bacterium]
MSQHDHHPGFIKGPGVAALCGLMLPLALLSACAGSSEENRHSAQTQGPEKPHYLAAVLEPVRDSNAEPAEQAEQREQDRHRNRETTPDRDRHTSREKNTATGAETTAVSPPSTNGPTREQDLMTVMVLEPQSGQFARFGLKTPLTGEPEQSATGPAPEADPVVLVPPEPRQLRFAFDTSELSARDQSLLSAHARFLKARPDYRLTISGHTDASGPAGYNRRLSYRRAQSVALFLQGKGVDPAQLEVTGLGSDRPRAGEPHQQRRVELDYQGPQMLSRQQEQGGVSLP